MLNCPCPFFHFFQVLIGKLDNFGTLLLLLLLSLFFNPLSPLPSRLLQVWQQLWPHSGPHWWTYRIRTAGRSRSPDRWGSRTENPAPTTSPDISGQTRTARRHSSIRFSAAAPSPGTRHGHGTGPGQAGPDGTSWWTHGTGQADRSSRNHTNHNGE